MRKTIGINLNYISGIKQPSAMYGYQRINRTNPNANIDTLTMTIDSSLTVWDTTYLIQDARVHFIKINNLFTLRKDNIPINRNQASYWIRGTFNSIVEHRSA